MIVRAGGAIWLNPFAVCSAITVVCCVFSLICIMYGIKYIIHFISMKCVREGTELQFGL